MNDQLNFAKNEDSNHMIPCQLFDVSWCVYAFMPFYVLSFVLWCPLRYSHKTMFSSSLRPVDCRMARVLFILFTLFLVVSTHMVLCFFFFVIVFVFTKLPVSLDCPFLIAPSVFSNVYLFPWKCFIRCIFKEISV